MNSSWTGRAPRMLRDCHFSDGADPLERTQPRPYGVAWWVSMWVVVLVGLMAVIHFAQS